MDRNKHLQITDLMFGCVEEHDLSLQKMIESNPDYVKTLNNLNEKLNNLDVQTKIDIDSDFSYMEIIARDTAFNEGFKLAVKLILSSVQ